MVEVLVAAAFVMAAIVAFSRRGGAVILDTSSDHRTDPDSADLPCPWCRGPTTEDDARCHTCGQRFG